MAIPAVRSKSEMWEDLIRAEVQGSAVQALSCVCNFVKAHADESFASVEKRLRVQGRVTHLFARSVEEQAREFGNMPEVVAVLDPRTFERRPYIVRVLMECYPDLAPKIQAFGANQAENLVRLKDAGIPVLRIV